MGFKKYVVFSILFIVAVYLYAFSLELGTYKVTVLDISLPLPIEVWIIVPLVLLFVATIGHLMFYGLIGAFKQRAVNKDHDAMLAMIKATLLGKNSTKRFKTAGFKNLSSVLSQFELKTKDGAFSSTDAELNKIVATMQDINSGKHVNDKSVKFSEVSPVVTQNLLNKVNEQVDFAVDVLKKTENYSDEVVKQAFINVVNDKSMTTVKKLYKNVKLDKYLAKILFEKDAANNEFGFTSDEILAIVKSLNFLPEDYMFLAKNYETILQPDQIIALFDKLSSEIEEATPAYLHVLFEYEMIDKIREIVAPSAEGEYTAYKALLDLKDAGKHYDLETISYK